MNEMDLHLANRMIKDIENDLSSSKFVFNTTFTQISKTNLLLLKGFLDIQKKSGLFTVLDRPHQYMSYLLNMHGVSQENLWFIDAVTHTSGQELKRSRKVNFLASPFHVDRLLEDIEFYSNNKTKGFIPLQKVDFLMIDNIATMLNYNMMRKVEDFVVSLSDFQKEYDHIVISVTIDRESNPKLCEVLLEYFDSIIDTEELKNEIQI